MKNKMRIQDHINDVPADYFESLDNKVLDRIRREKELEEGGTYYKKASMFRYFPSAAAIAVFAALLGLVYNESLSSGTDSFTRIYADSVELENYIENTVLNDDELVYLLSEEVVDSLYNAEISLSSNEFINNAELQDLEEEFDLEYEETEI